MANIRFGGGIADARGSHGGSVYSRNHSGAISMVRTTGVNPKTSSQTLFRQRLPRMANQWAHTLSDADRAAWRAFASTTPVINRIGNTTTLSGAQMHSKLNGFILLTGHPMITTPPASTAIDTMLTFSIAATSGGGGTVLVTNTTTALYMNEDILLYMSPPMSPGRNYVSSALRFLTAVTRDFAGADVTTAYKAVFGTLPGSAGQRIFGRAICRNHNTGITSPALQATSIFA